MPYRYIFPVLYFLALALVSRVLDFNGLYGQDAHEYFRQSGAFYARAQGLPYESVAIGEAEIANGYPLAGVVLQTFGLDTGTALLILSWLGAAASLWLFGLNLRLLSYGSHARSRWVYGFLGLGLAPFMIRAGLTVMSDAFGLALTLAALFFAMRSIEQQRSQDIPLFGLFAGLAFITRYGVATLLALPALALALELWRERRWGWLLGGAGAGLFALLPWWWVKSGASAHMLDHSLIQGWSVLNLFKRTFTAASGTASFSWPNAVYILFPFFHPGFCVTLPALWLLAKRTDVRLYSKRILALSLIVYLLFIGGLPYQNQRYLLPAYAVLLLLFFPAWDRFFAYGLYFFKRLTHALLGLTFLCQVLFGAYLLRPTLQRNQMERQVAHILEGRLLPGDVVYAIDLDISLKTYLPGLEFRNLWVQEYDTFPAGAYFIFNETKLSRQWAGMPPMRNWEQARAHHELREITTLPGAWILYRVVK